MNCAAKCGEELSFVGRKPSEENKGGAFKTDTSTIRKDGFSGFPLTTQP